MTAPHESAAPPIQHGTHISFEFFGPSASGKTDVWHVLEKSGGGVLGDVRWYGPWRCYAFNPNPCTVFEKVCLREIAEFCERLTARQKERSHVV